MDTIKTNPSSGVAAPSPGSETPLKLEPHKRGRIRRSGGLSAAMTEAIAAMQQHGDVEYRTYRWNNGLLARGEWRDANVKVDAPRMATLEALRRRGLVEEYQEMTYCGHGEYDDWQCWRLEAAGDSASDRERKSPKTPSSATAEAGAAAAVAGSAGAADVTAGAVRWSAWFGDVVDVFACAAMWCLYKTSRRSIYLPSVGKVKVVESSPETPVKELICRLHTAALRRRAERSRVGVPHATASGGSSTRHPTAPAQRAQQP